MASELDELRLGLIARDRGSFAEAVVWFTRGIACGSPCLGKLLFERSKAYAALGLYNKSQVDLEACADEEPTDAYSCWELGLAFEKLSKRHIAERLYNRAIEIDPQFAAAYYHKAELDFHDGLLELAVLGFSRVIELEPEYDFGFAMRGACYARLRQHERARADFEKALLINEANQVAVSGLQALLNMLP